MAIQYFQPMLTKFMGTALRYCLSGGSASNPSAITLMKGAQPSAASIVSSWSTYNGSVLVHWDDVNWLEPPDKQTLTAQKSTTTNLATARTAVASGTAEWAILWCRKSTVVDQTSVLSTTLPYSQFIVVPASGPTGNGVVKVASTTIVSGTSYQYTDVTIRMGIS